MRNIFLLYCSCMLLFSGCSKDKGCKSVEPESEKAQILAFAAAQNLNVTRHSSGMYCEVVYEGHGNDIVTDKSTVTVKYTAEFLSGDKGVPYEQSNNYTRKLPEVIEGWQLGIRLLKKGGKIKLIIPSALAYGCNGSDPIPPNSVLYFDVELINVQ